MSQLHAAKLRGTMETTIVVPVVPHFFPEGGWVTAMKKLLSSFVPLVDCGPHGPLDFAAQSWDTCWFVLQFRSSDSDIIEIQMKFRTGLVRNRSGQMIWRWKDIFKRMKFALLKPFKMSNSIEKTFKFFCPFSGLWSPWSLLTLQNKAETQHRKKSKSFFP